MKVFREKQGDMFDDFSQDELERAYRRGCEHGYRKAMEEVERGRYASRYEHDSMGERQYRDSMGRFR